MKTIGYVIVIFFLGFFIIKQEKEAQVVELPMPDLQSNYIKLPDSTKAIDNLIIDTEKNLKYLRYAQFSD